MGVVGRQSDVLPPLYARWASEFLSGAIPAESEATCSDCAMVSGEGAKARPAAAPFFNPRHLALGRHSESGGPQHHEASNHQESPHCLCV